MRLQNKYSLKSWCPFLTTNLWGPMAFQENTFKNGEAEISFQDPSFDHFPQWQMTRSCILRSEVQSLV